MLCNTYFYLPTPPELTHLAQAGIGRDDQLYVYVTPLRDNWLGDLIASNSA